MAQAPVLTFPRFLEAYRYHFTRPSFLNMVVLACGWVLSGRLHAVTEALVATGASGLWHHAAFHRFFSTARWDADRWGLALLRQLRPVFAPNGILQVVIDDTLAPKKGPHIHGIGTHIDAVRSSRRFRVFTFGHVWVVLCVVVAVPFSSQPWALPILFRLYRTQKAAARARLACRTKTELARELLHLVAGHQTDWKFVVAADSAYANSTVLEGLPPNVTFVGAMRPDAVLTAPPPPFNGRGRPKRRGDVLPKPSQVAHDDTRYRSAQVHIYGKQQTAFFKTFTAQWYRACGATLLRVVVVRCDRGSIPFRVYFSTDLALSPVDIIELYSRRWSIEFCFRNLKQLFGFADSSARVRKAVCRVAPFVGVLYSCLVLWFTLHVHRPGPINGLPVRPWYTQKRNTTFEDILRAARLHLARPGVLDLPRMLADFTETPPAPVPTSRRRRQLGS